MIESPHEAVVAYPPPGPWLFVPLFEPTDGTAAGHIVGADAEGETARIAYLEEVRCLDLRLLLAAPELLDVCQAFVDLNEHNGVCGCAGFCEPALDMWGAAQKLAEAAIERATGVKP